MLNILPPIDKKNIRFIKNEQGNRIVEDLANSDSESTNKKGEHMIIAVAGVGMISQHISTKIIDILNSHTQAISNDILVVEIDTNEKKYWGYDKEKISQDTIEELLIITKIDRDDSTDVLLQNNISTPRYPKKQKRSGWQKPQKAKGSTKRQSQRKK